MAEVQEVTEATFEDQVLNADLPTLVDFWAAWCGPCVMMGPTVERLAAEQEGRLKIVKLNVETDPEVAFKYGVTNIPTFMLFVGGELKERFTGYMPMAKMVERLSGYIQ